MVDFSKGPQPPTAPSFNGPTTRVALTKAQRAEVKEHTGRDIEFIRITDEDGTVMFTMSQKHPDDITPLAIRYAEILNDYDEAYHAYILALAKWQDEELVAQAEKAQELEDEAEAEIEELQESYAEFYAAEGAAINAAKEAALEAWDPKGKKRKKAGK